GYRGFESLSLRQQVVKVREVIRHRAEIIAFGRNSRTFPPPPCSRETAHRLFGVQTLRDSLNAKSRVQVCAPTCTGELALLTPCAADHSANRRLCLPGYLMRQAHIRAGHNI